MEQWEKIQEEQIKQEHELRKNYKPLTLEQQRQHMQQNWVEVTDKNGKPFYIHKEEYIDMILKHQKLPIKRKKSANSVFLFFWHVLELVVGGCIILLLLANLLLQISLLI